jgi:hypothetical protein
MSSSALPVDGANQRVDGDGAGTDREQDQQDRDPIDVLRPPHRGRDIDLQQHRHRQQSQRGQAGREADDQANRQRECGIGEEIGGNRGRDGQIGVLGFEQLERRRLDLGRQDHGIIEVADAQADRDARPLDPSLAGQEKEPRHDEAQPERHQRIGDHGTDRAEPGEDRGADGP